MIGMTALDSHVHGKVSLPPFVEHRFESPDPEVEFWAPARIVEVYNRQSCNRNRHRFFSVRLLRKARLRTCGLNSARGMASFKSSSSLRSSAGDQKSRPWLVVQATDLDHRMTVRRIVDELSAANVHAGVGDLVRRSAKK
jgi:hypothetical protein